MMRALLFPPFLPPAAQVPERRPPPSEPSAASFDSELESAISREPERPAPSRESAPVRDEPRSRSASREKPEPSRARTDDAHEAPSANVAPEPPPTADTQPASGGEPQSRETPETASNATAEGGGTSAGGESDTVGPTTTVNINTPVTTLLPAPAPDGLGAEGARTPADAAVAGVYPAATTAAGPAASQSEPASTDPVPAETPSGTTGSSASGGAGFAAIPAGEPATGSGQNGDGRPQDGGADPQSQRPKTQTSASAANQAGASAERQAAVPPTRAEMIGSATPPDENASAEDRPAAKVVAASDSARRPKPAAGGAPAHGGPDNLATQVARALVAVAADGAAGEHAAAPTESDTSVTGATLQPAVGIVSANGASEATATRTAPQPTVPTATAAGQTTTDGTNPFTGDKNIDEVARIVSANVGTRNAQARLQLDPPSLGQMQIDVGMRQDVMTLRIEVETQTALSRIHSNVAQLKQAIETHGVVVDRFEVQIRGTDSASPRSDHGDGNDARFADTPQTFSQNESGTGSSFADGRDAPADSRSALGSESSVATQDRDERGVLTAASVDLLA